MTVLTPTRMCAREGCEAPLSDTQRKWCSRRCLERSRPPQVRHPEASRRYYDTAKADPEKWARMLAGNKARKESVNRFLAAVKLTAGCIDCGYNDCSVAMDFDHLADKKNMLSSWKITTIRAAVVEMEKCVVRCANCHRIKTWADTPAGRNWSEA